MTRYEESLQLRAAARQEHLYRLANNCATCGDHLGASGGVRLDWCEGKVCDYGVCMEEAEADKRSRDELAELSGEY